MIPSSTRYNFRPKKKGINTPPPRARIRGITFVEASTNLAVQPEAFDVVLARIGYHYRRYQTGRCTESIRLRLFNLAYRIDRHRNIGSRSAAATSYTQGIFEQDKLHLDGYVSALHSRPNDDRNIRVIDGYITSTLLTFPEYGFTREIINEALARSIPVRVAPYLQRRRPWWYRQRTPEAA